MPINVGTADRIVRAVLGVALLWIAFASGLPIVDNAIVKYGAAILGGVMLLTALLRSCPLYSVLGVKTCKTG